MSAHTIQFILNVVSILFVFVIWLAIFFRLKKTKSSSYLFFFTAFYIYIVAVLYYTLFQFQSLLILKHFASGIMLNGQAAGESINLVPLVKLTLGDVKTSLLNILLFVPFGFGLPFISKISFKKILFAGFLFSIGVELLQFVTGLVGGVTFRVTDINDVIFNTLGVAIGYGLFVLFGRGIMRLCEK